MENMDLFAAAEEKAEGSKFEPLAQRMRPRNFDDFIGQQEAVGRGRFLRQMIERDQLPSLIFYGPPGTGKTTLAQMIAQMTKSAFYRLNAVAAGINDIRQIVKQAEEQRRFYTVKVFERDDKAIEKLGLSQDAVKKADAITKKTETELDDDAESIITNERYVTIEKLLKDGYKKQGQGKLTLSDKIDRIVTNRWLAIPIFLVVMWIVYYLILIGMMRLLD